MHKLAMARWRKRNPVSVGMDIIKQAKDVPCADCGKRYPHYVMDFDHVREGKLANVSNLAKGNVDTLLAEIAKCDVVCANCHRERTYRSQ